MCATIGHGGLECPTAFSRDSDYLDTLHDITEQRSKVAPGYDIGRFGQRSGTDCPPWFGHLADIDESMVARMQN